MRFRMPVSAVVCLFAAVFSAPTLNAHATSFNIYALGQVDNAEIYLDGFIGNALVLTYYGNGAGFFLVTPDSGGITYTHVSTLPGPVESGSGPCFQPVNTGGLVGASVFGCDGAYTALVASSNIYEEVSGGAPSFVSAVGRNFELYLSSTGEIAFIEPPPNNPTGYEIDGYLAVPAPTPEPSSLLLLGTGVLGVGGLVRRRFASAA